jgi:phosphate acyltransferase
LKIVLDGMGGDFAPRAAVEGAILAVQEYDIEIIIVGQEELIKTELAKANYSSDKITVHQASEIIEMGEHPGNAIRRKKDSSIVVGTRLVKEGVGDAFISAGNTGACMAAALFGLGRIKGIQRPAIGTVMPTDTGISLVLDVGANADCKPIHLVQFALMGSIYAEKVLGINKPKVGLLNIGEEESKGNELTLGTYPLLKKTKLNFVGNIEGRDIFWGKSDVVVCDGFVGNVVLKLSEGLASFLMNTIKEQLMTSTIGKIGGALIKPLMGKLKKKLDYAQYGGAPLLGIDGISIISHGSSNGIAIKNAIRVAKECVNNEVVRCIKNSLEDNLSTGDENINEQ